MTEPSPPLLSSLAEVCVRSGLTMNEIAYLDYREPGFDLAALDAQYGDADIPDPATTAHKLTRFYLLGAGDCVYSIGQLLALPEPMIVSPAVLARSAVEYASRTNYIASEDDHPTVRMSKMARLSPMDTTTSD